MADEYKRDKLGRFIPKTLFIPTMSESLAYVLGVLKGDGMVYRGYSIKLNVTSKSFALSFANALKAIGLSANLHLIPPSIGSWSKANQFLILSGSKAFYKWFKSLTLERLTFLLLAKRNFVQAFIRGFYESEGSCSLVAGNTLKYGSYYRITISNTNLRLLRLIKKLLEFLDFNPTLRRNKRKGWAKNRKAEYHVRLNRTAEVKRFLVQINPLIKHGDFDA